MTVGSPPAPQHARSRILAIDDAPEVLDQIRYALGGEFDILATRDGVRGADIAKRLQPELVLLDVMMPDIDGFEVSSFKLGNISIFRYLRPMLC